MIEKQPLTTVVTAVSRSSHKREQILTSAINLFCSNGFHNTSMDEVAKLADVSKQTVYSHFGCKDVLFAAAIESKCIEHQLSDILLDVPAEPETTLMFFAKHFGEMIVSADAITVYQACVAQADTHPQTSQLYFNAGPLHVFSLLEDYFKAVSKLGQYYFSQPRHCAVRLCLMLFGEQRIALELGIDVPFSAEDRTRYLHDTVSMFLRAYEAKS
ncbi:TetR/AcrR family transcriptional regulator [Shewanella intestini]|uniref:TetR/AcrR family transcriptional regulator n=1 Tax=Shewanella intestini TaxID=2017544 RepID=A0ABS5HYU2_9GAMM|nr:MULTISPECIES: TetR/AcrR family transcriptional regulator [Shewanella]MBR9726723.1 TetR/AcrR family transcriptional regulator [Shewanella intestini]MRG34711.1 TetR family transcriptional regulator [Shewanella sp. XMDDZSB0408]